MAQWAKFPWKEALFSNADESILRQAPAAAENVYANAAGGFSRFPGLRKVLDLPGAGRCYPYRWRDDLYLGTESGRIYRVSQLLAAEDVTGVPLSGGQRPIFSASEDELMIAAGGPILRLAGPRTEILSDAAPNSTHVAYIDGYTIAIEGPRFWFSDPGQARVWQDLSVFTAEAKPDDLNAVVVTPYRELLLAGPDSIEQFERLNSGDKPFFRRWTTGEGLAHPYTFVTDTTGNWGVNGKAEFTKFQAQVSREKSGDIAMSLEAVDDWTDAWAAPLYVGGQRFIVLQAPEATTYYGTKGATFLLDVRASKWAFLYGWDRDTAQPTRWPGWGAERAWNRTWVGIEDGLAELTKDTWDNLGTEMRSLQRSAHVSDFGPSRVDNVRLRIKRGVTPSGQRASRFMLRMIRDNERPTRWIEKDLGNVGHSDMTLTFGGMGMANTWQMEIACSDPAPWEMVEAWIQVERLGW